MTVPAPNAPAVPYIDVRNLGFVMFAGIRNDPQTTPDTLSGLQRLVDASPTLRAELQVANERNVTISINHAPPGSPAYGESHYDVENNVIILAAPDFSGTVLTHNLASPLNGTAGSMRLTPAGEMIGILSHELGHVFDGDYRLATLIGSHSTPENRLIAGVLSEGALLRNSG